MAGAQGLASFPPAIVKDLLPETEDLVEGILRGLTVSAPELKAYSKQTQLRAARLIVYHAPAIAALAKELLRGPRLHREAVHAIWEAPR